MTVQRQEKIKALLKKGVRVPNPESVEIGPEVEPDRISDKGVVIYSGCKVNGAKTLILPDVSLNILTIT